MVLTRLDGVDPGTWANKPADVPGGMFEPD
jgi:hypothetical protein